MSAAAKALGDGGGVIWRGGPQADTGRAIALLSEEGGEDRAVDIHQVAGQAVVHIGCGATRAQEFATKGRPDDAALCCALKSVERQAPELGFCQWLHAIHRLDDVLRD